MVEVRDVGSSSVGGWLDYWSYFGESLELGARGWQMFYFKCRIFC